MLNSQSSVPLKQTPRIVVAGGGGHAHVVIEILQESGVEVVGILDPDSSTSEVLGVPNLGGDDALATLSSWGVHGAVPAVGDNARRRIVFDRIVAAGLEPFSAIHPRAAISRSAVIGRGTVIMANAVLNAQCRIGDNCIINTAASIDHHGDIGEDVHIAPGCRLAGNVTVGNLSFLGIGVTVTPDVRIGAGVFAPAGLTITRDVPDGTRLRRVSRAPGGSLS